MEKFLKFILIFILGCLRCYPDRGQKLADGKTAEELYERTNYRAYILQHQMRLVEIWECDWLRVLARNAEIRAIHDQCFVPPPMDPRRHALRGGRVEAFTMHRQLSDGEIMEYYDVVKK